MGLWLGAKAVCGLRAAPRGGAWPSAFAAATARMAAVEEGEAVGERVLVGSVRARLPAGGGCLGRRSGIEALSTGSS